MFVIADETQLLMKTVDLFHLSNKIRGENILMAVSRFMFS